MTKLLMIDKTQMTAQVAFSDVSVCLDLVEALSPGLNVLILKLDIKEINGKEINAFTFTLDESLADKGVMLAGAYQREGNLKVLLYNLGNSTVGLESGAKVLTAHAYDKMVLRQNAEATPIAPVPPKPKVHRRKRSPTH